MSYRWFGNGYVLLGFSCGYVAVVSTQLREVGREQSSGEPVGSSLAHLRI